MTGTAEKRVLVVDDDAGMRAGLEASFLRKQWKVITAAGAAEAIARFRASQPGLVVTDIRMPDGDGLLVMREVRAIAPQTPVILLTAYGSVPDAVGAIKDGACDYLIKPVAFEHLESLAEQVLQRAPETEAAGSPFVGQSLPLQRALERLRQAAPTDADILVQAESGTGKELAARLIHRLSSRHGRPFVAVNCAAFPETLLESELFGHARGAFTGATAAKPGKFELADGGTLLLDEIGEMPLPLQPKLLRVLQEREFDRLGDTHSMKVDVRIIATTNRRLDQLVEEGGFRADLYYRLNVIPLTLPALRERKEDIRELAGHFARAYTPRGRCVPRLTEEFLIRLEAHNWPGNVRELSNLMRRAVALSNGVIGAEALDSALDPAPAVAREILRPGLSLEAMERQLFAVTLDATGGNRSRAAEMLGVSLRTVRNKIRGFGLPPRQVYSAVSPAPASPLIRRGKTPPSMVPENGGYQEKLCP